jgi:hypothetical protein
LGGVTAAIPDALQFLYHRSRKKSVFLNLEQALHDWAHFDKNKYRSKAVRLTTTIAASLIAALILLF